jgi:hypothetical protein
VRTTVAVSLHLPGSPGAPGAARHTTSTTTPSVVTLQPASPSGGIPGDANDPGDFYGFGAAIVGIALAILVTRLLFRRGTRRSER